MPAEEQRRATHPVASVDAAEYERARASAQTAAFWAEVDELEHAWAAESLDHAPTLAPDPPR